MFDGMNFANSLNMQKITRVGIFFLFLIFLPAPGFAQHVAALYDKITRNFNQKSYYSTLNLCKEVIQICETSPEPECWYTNIMKDIYRFKGIAEFEIYKKELKKKRLADAITSLKLSYNLFRDPEVQFLRGYLQALYSILVRKRSDLKGIVIAWESLLNLYARNGWKISSDLVDRTKLFIRVAEKFTQPIPAKKYSGVFAKFIIVMACDLVEKGNLSAAEKKYFETVRAKYCQDEALQWQKWRGQTFTPN